jgi:hypothetical protein
MSSAEENKALVCRFIEAQDKGDLETLDELLAPDFVDHSLLLGQEPGREGYMKSVAEDCAAVPWRVCLGVRTEGRVRRAGIIIKEGEA